eukprot:TRINITY_DN860_c0_g1_i1.p1 TRINITY_DN860_c0_g1~~TRINITY_DN860_c0_g1_i1.p1  ORF type:complete len:1054 (-),score=384.13 TRINITY_DN860_c0_g1_i1:154-3315(-)
MFGEKERVLLGCEIDRLHGVCGALFKDLEKWRRLAKPEDVTSESTPKLEAEIASLKRSLSQREVEIARLKEELVSPTNFASPANSKSKPSFSGSNVHSAVSKLTSPEPDLQARILELQQALEEERRERKLLKDQSKEYDSLLFELEMRVPLLGAEIERLQLLREGTVSNGNKSEEDLKREVQRLTSDKQALEARVKAQGEREKNLMSLLETKEATIKLLEREYAENNEALTQLREALKVAESRVTPDLSYSKRDYELLEEKLNLSEKEKLFLSTQHNIEIGKKTQELEEAKDKIASLAIEVERLVADLGTANEKLVATEALNDELASARRSLETVEGRGKAELRAKVAEYESSLEQMRWIVEENAKKSREKYQTLLTKYEELTRLFAEAQSTAEADRSALFQWRKTAEDLRKTLDNERILNSTENERLRGELTISNEKLEHLSSEMLTLQQQMASIGEENASERAKVSHLSGQVSQWQQHCADLERKLKGKSEEIESLTQEIEALKDRESRLEGEIDAERDARRKEKESMRRALDEELDKSVQLSAALAKATEDGRRSLDDLVRDKGTKLAEAEATIQRLKTELSVKEQELKKTDSSLRETSHELGSVTVQCEVLTSRVISLEEGLQKVTREASDAKDLLKKLDVERQALIKSHEQLENNSNENKEKLKENEGKIAKLLKEIEILQGQVAEAKDLKKKIDVERQALVKSHEQLEQTIGELKGDLRENEGKIAKLHKEIESLQGQLATALREKTAAEKANDSLRGEIDDLKRSHLENRLNDSIKLSEIEDEKTALSSEKMFWSIEREKLDKTIGDLRYRVDELTSKNEKLTQDLKQKESQLSDLQYEYSSLNDGKILLSSELERLHTTRENLHSECERLVAENQKLSATPRSADNSFEKQQKALIRNKSGIPFEIGLVLMGLEVQRLHLVRNEHIDEIDDLENKLDEKNAEMTECKDLLEKFGVKSPKEAETKLVGIEAELSLLKSVQAREARSPKDSYKTEIEKFLLLSEIERLHVLKEMIIAEFQEEREELLAENEELKQKVLMPYPLRTSE